MANITLTSFSPGIKTQFERRLLMRAVPRMVHNRAGVQAKISNYGSLEWRKYGALSTITTALTEGTTPVEQAAPTITQITATPVFYGAWIGYTDELNYEIYDPFVSEVSGILGEQAGVSADTIIRNAMTDGATKSYSGGEPGRSSISAPVDNVTYGEFIKRVAYLEAQNAVSVEGDNFVCIMHPHDLATLMQDPTWVNLFIEESDQGETALRTGVVGRLFRCNIYLSANARKYVDGGVGGTDVYSMLFVGQEAYGVVGIAGITPSNINGATGYSNLTGQSAKAKPVDLIVKSIGSAGADDPLNMRGTIGWKMAMDIKILNSAWILDHEHSNEFSLD